MGGELKLLFYRCQGTTEGKQTRCNLLEGQSMQLLVFRLVSPSRAAHPLARPGCQLLKSHPAEELSPALSQHHLSVPGDVAEAFPAAVPALPHLQLQQHSCPWDHRHAPPAPSPQKKGRGVIFSRLSGVILSSPCGPQTCWHILLFQQGQESSSGAGRVAEPSECW